MFFALFVKKLLQIATIPNVLICVFLYVGDTAVSIIICMTNNILCEPMYFLHQAH